jgi:cyclase
MNSAAVLNPEAFVEATEAFGSQCMVIAIDARRVSPTLQKADPYVLNEHHPGRTSLSVDDDSRWEVYIQGGRTPTGIDAVKWSEHAARLGAGEVLLTSMDEDGQQEGYDLSLTRAIADTVNIPVIASGGAGTTTHLAQAFTEGHASAALAASIFHYGDCSIAEAKQTLSSLQIPMRTMHQ